MAAKISQNTCSPARNWDVTKEKGVCDMSCPA